MDPRAPDSQFAPPPGHVPQAVVPMVPPARRGAGRWLLPLVLLAVLAVLAMFGLALVRLSTLMPLAGDEGVREKHHSLNRLGTDKIAIITLEGTILDGDGFVKQQIDQVRDDQNVKAVVLRVNSPGGSVTASDYLYHHLKRLVRERKLPLVVSMGGMAASGGYYVSMAVGDVPDTIFAEPTTWTGSIGVVIPHYNVAGLMEKWQIEEDSIKSHPLKQMGSPTREMTDEERKIFQGLVDESFERFKDVVKHGRPVFRKQAARLDEVATGQVFTTRQALEHGLVDHEGFIEDAIARAAELADLDENHIQVIEYEHLGGLFSFVLGAQAQSERSELSALLDLASPRAYYLCTWLPEAARNTVP